MNSSPLVFAARLMGCLLLGGSQAVPVTFILSNTAELLLRTEILTGQEPFWQLTLTLTKPPHICSVPPGLYFVLNYISIFLYLTGTKN